MNWKYATCCVAYLGVLLFPFSAFGDGASRSSVLQCRAKNYISYSDFPTYGFDSTQDYLEYKREQVARFSNIVVDTRTGSVRFGDSESLNWEVKHLNGKAGAIFLAPFKSSRYKSILGIDYLGLRIQPGKNRASIEFTLTRGTVVGGSLMFSDSFRGACVSLQ